MAWPDEVLGSAGKNSGFVTLWDAAEDVGLVLDASGQTWVLLRADVPGGRALAVGTPVAFTGPPVDLKGLGYPQAHSVDLIPAESLLETCADCGVEPGTGHHEGCDWAACPECGDQLLMHEEHEPDRAALWHGIDTATEIARKLGWWTRRDEFARVEDYDNVNEAKVRGYIVWDRDAQRWVKRSTITAEHPPVGKLVEALLVGCGSRRGEQGAIRLLGDAAQERGFWGFAWLDRSEFRRRFVTYTEDPAVTSAPVASIAWAEAVRALDAGELECPPEADAMLRAAAGLVAE